MYRRACITLSLLAGTLLFADQVLAARRYVDAGAGGANTGLTWGDAYTDLQTALGDVAATEIWVAAGTYTPGGSRFSTFQLKNGVAIHGGFRGGLTGETQLGQRDGSAGPSILSGDIGVQNSDLDNSYHVVTGSGVDATAILEGFSVQHGTADLSSLKRFGGGLLVEGAGSEPTIINVEFRSNTARDAGGGMYNNEGSPKLIGCVFRDNTTTASGIGAAIFTDRGRARFINCTILNNVAAGQTGGVFTHEFSGSGCPDNAEFYNCIIFGNTDGDVDGNTNSMDQVAQISADLTFCPPERLAVEPNPFVLTHSCVQNWLGTLGDATNFTDDPLFADATGAILPFSPCVDAGTNAALPADTLDLDTDSDTTERIAREIASHARIVNTTVDVGAFEAAQDCNNNGFVDADEIAAGTSLDCNTNGFPDDCDTVAVDCNGNGSPDDCEIATGLVTDCNLNGVPDECDVAGGSSDDCNANLFPDQCELDYHFFVLDNADVGNPSQVQAFNLATGAASAPVITDLPASGNDRGMTVLPGDGRLLVTDFVGQRLLDIDVYFQTVNAIMPVDRPLLELAYDWEHDLLFATTPTGGLYRVDTSVSPAETTLVTQLPGASPEDWVCLAYDPRTHLLVGASQTEELMHYLDPLTGDAQPVQGSFGLGLADLAVDPSDGAIYGVSMSGGLHEVDRVTGDAGAPVLTIAGVSKTAAGLAVSFAADCNGNTELDACDIASSFSDDCNSNGVPDVCDLDCNANAVADDCEAIGLADFDADGDVDLLDADALVDCLSGPSAPPSPAASECGPTCLEAFDLDGDFDVDLKDFQLFLLLFTG